MEIVLFAHPEFLRLHSLQRFTYMLADGLRLRGHHVEVWRPVPWTYRLKLPFGLRKWLGYIDQYILFPLKVQRDMRRLPATALLVFTDHALGPWVRLAGKRPVVVHCHDFLAQQSALGMIRENRISFTGKIYQAYIRNGYKKADNFICVSEKTRADLIAFMERPCRSEVVYNGLPDVFSPGDAVSARTLLGQALDMDLSAGYLLHVGGNQWYKNRKGVIMLYDAWRSVSRYTVPLLMVGDAPEPGLKRLAADSPYKKDILWLPGLDDRTVRLAYSGASVFLFPSIAEGFGWPVAEAMGCGTLVLTTAAQPMIEVAGDAGFFMESYPHSLREQGYWAKKGARLLEKLVDMKPEERRQYIKKGLLNVQRFGCGEMLNKIERFYKRTLDDYYATYSADIKS